MKPKYYWFYYTLPRMTPHIFIQTEIYDIGVSIAKHIPSI